MEVKIRDAIRIKRLMEYTRFPAVESPIARLRALDLMKTPFYIEPSSCSTFQAFGSVYFHFIVFVKFLSIESIRSNLDRLQR